MAHLTYQVVEHDGGYAYKVGDVFSERFPTHQQAHDAAAAAAERQRASGASEAIEYQDSTGTWHEEQTKGGDRPMTEVEDNLED